MTTKEAKDFLVQQVAEQAALEKVSVSDLEKRMMFFTETDSASCENPIDLNTEFEEQYDTKEYELKISGLLHSAHKRVKREDAANLRSWEEAVRTLRKGDHYILVLLDVNSELARPVLRIWVTLAWGVGLSIAIVILLMLAIVLDHVFHNPN